MSDSARFPTTSASEQPTRRTPGARQPFSSDGRFLGRYWLCRVVAEGGMGVVLEGRDLGGDRLVAVKLLQRRFCGDGASERRFLREAELLGRVDNDHVARVFESGTCPEVGPYIVMELLEGRTVAELLERHGALAPDEAVYLARQACAGVAAAHALGIVHRDLKPSNLYVTVDDSGATCLKVIDFGIARDARADGPRITREGESLGSVSHMAPEQFASPGTADERADIWALGVVLYNLLTARTPFPGGDAAAVEAAVRNDPPCALGALAANGGALESIVLRCLAKHPAARFATVSELDEALAALPAASDADVSAGIVSLMRRGRRSPSSFPAAH